MPEPVRSGQSEEKIGLCGEGLVSRPHLLGDSAQGYLLP